MFHATNVAHYSLGCWQKLFLPSLVHSSWELFRTLLQPRTRMSNIKQNAMIQEDHIKFSKLSSSSHSSLKLVLYLSITPSYGQAPLDYKVVWTRWVRAESIPNFCFCTIVHVLIWNKRSSNAEIAVI